LAALDRKAAAMRQKLSFVLIVIAALLVKVVAPTPGSPRSYFTSLKMAVPSSVKSFPTELLPE